MSSRSKRNDDERREWVLSDEGLYRLMRAAHPGKRDGEYDVRAWIAKNRAVIDEVIDAVRSGKKSQGYLVYG